MKLGSITERQTVCSVTVFQVWALHFTTRLFCSILPFICSRLSSPCGVPFSARPAAAVDPDSRLSRWSSVFAFTLRAEVHLHSYIYARIPISLYDSTSLFVYLGQIIIGAFTFTLRAASLIVCPWTTPARSLLPGSH